VREISHARLSSRLRAPRDAWSRPLAKNGFRLGRVAESALLRVSEGRKTSSGAGASPATGASPTTGAGAGAVAGAIANPATGVGASSGVAAGRPVDRGSFRPLSADRVQVKFTASRELEEKIALARDLMSHRNPRGDLAAIFEAALDLWIKDALNEKLGVTERAQKKPRPAKRERVTNRTRREVLDRDGLGCTFVNERGERCGERAFLELDHRKSKGTGGGPEPENMRFLCRAHNQAEAERVYGKAHMERCRRGRGKKGNDEVRERTSTAGSSSGSGSRGETDLRPRLAGRRLTRE
jgi:hypothetical protein